MSAPGRPQAPYRSAKHEGCLMSAPGRPQAGELPLGWAVRSARVRG